MRVIDTVATGATIKAMMKKRKLTVTDVQSKCYLQTQMAVYKWLRGDSIPTVDNLVILAELFGCKIDDIIKTRRIRRF